MLGGATVARAAPDGTTLLLATPSLFGSAPGAFSPGPPALPPPRLPPAARRPRVSARVSMSAMATIP